MKRQLRRFLTLIFGLGLALALLFQACSQALEAQGPSQNDTTAVAERMADAHQTDSPSASPIGQVEPTIAIDTETVQYATVAGQAINGYLAKPEGAAPGLPGIVMIHEWWGLNDNIEAMARRLAGEGYTVLAVDLYGGQIATAPDQARTLVRAVGADIASAQANLSQAYDFLVSQYEAPKVGSIGWCFGGGWSLQMGLLLPEQLDAMVMYYGRVETDTETLASLEMPILGIFGAEDQAIPTEQVRTFEQALAALNKQANIYIYEGVGHAFANPSGQNYVAEAAEDAWDKTVRFFEMALANG